MPQPNPLALPHRPLRLLSGLALAALIVVLIGLVFWSIIDATGAGSVSGASVDLMHLLRMTSLQAGLTTVISIVIGIALAWALNRLDFPGRELVVGLFSSAIVTPGVVVAFGLLSIWGRNGLINQVSMALFGFPIAGSIFGLSGILIAHAILDAAFAARILLARLDTIPANRLKTGQSLSLSAVTRFRVIDWPALSGALPGLAAIIFLLAFTSFPIVLLLGGGPANQTLVVAIYSAVKLDFNLTGAVMLSLAQIGVCSAIILLSALTNAPSASLGRPRAQTWFDRPAARALQWLVLVTCVIAFALPLVSVLINGFGTGLPDLLARPSFWQAVMTTFGTSIAAALLTLVLALALTMARATTASPFWRILLGMPPYTYLAVPAVVLALGAFLLVRDFGVATDAAAPIVLVIGSALLALPFAVATLSPPLEAIARTRGKLIRSLGLSGWRQFALVEWPLIGRDVGVVLALSFCFALGDLGIIAMFGTEDFQTLPLMMVRALGAYRTNDAAAIAALMLVISIAAFTLLPRLFKNWSDAHP